MIMFIFLFVIYNNGGDNSADKGFQNIYNQRVTIFSNGSVKLLSPTIIKFTCKMNVEYFPFDRQVCQQTILYNARSVNLCIRLP